jgi:hypothetical protein
MLTRLLSVSVYETYCPTRGISIGSPITLPPAPATFRIAFLDIVYGDNDRRIL